MKGKDITISFAYYMLCFFAGLIVMHYIDTCTLASNYQKTIDELLKQQHALEKQLGEKK